MDGGSDMKPVQRTPPGQRPARANSDGGRIPLPRAIQSRVVGEVQTQADEEWREANESVVRATQTSEWPRPRVMMVDGQVEEHRLEITDVELSPFTVAVV